MIKLIYDNRFYSICFFINTSINGIKFAKACSMKIFQGSFSKSVCQLTTCVISSKHECHIVSLNARPSTTMCSKCLHSIQNWSHYYLRLFLLLCVTCICNLFIINIYNNICSRWLLHFRWISFCKDIAWLMCYLS